MIRRRYFVEFVRPSTSDPLKVIVRHPIRHGPPSEWDWLASVAGSGTINLVADGWRTMTREYRGGELVGCGSI